MRIRATLWQEADTGGVYEIAYVPDDAGAGNGLTPVDGAWVGEAEDVYAAVTRRLGFLPLDAIKRAVSDGKTKTMFDLDPSRRLVWVLPEVYFAKGEDFALSVGHVVTEPFSD